MRLTEYNYNMAQEAYYGTIFAQSNGYMGVRASFEENGSLGVQGAFVRGVIDEIPFNQNAKIDSEYMRKFYINEDAAKDAEFQEGVINFADILFLRIEIDAETFYPWEGRILKWNRTLDIENNILTRKVTWENTKGDVTELTFERFASFANDHVFCQRVHIKPINHDKKITVLSGVDLRTKSSGFKMCVADKVKFDPNSIRIALSTKGKYHHKINIGVRNSLTGGENINDGKFVYRKFDKTGEFTVEKLVYVSTSRDTDFDENYFGTNIPGTFDDLFSQHKAIWKEYFSKMDIKISGDDEMDKSLRFCTYHTAISIDRNDCVHSLAAKNLTGEGYNDYVWWDCEVYQAPVFIYSGSADVRNILRYRYDRLDAAKKIAKQEGRSGARFPFISSVTGEEKVWKHVRHPFMQIHVVADVAWDIINYFNATGDREYMEKYGLETLSAIADYWASRAEYKNGRYEICGVTGCDEHHPYVDNDAYTNYLVKYVLDETTNLCRDFEREISEKWVEVSKKLYLPMDTSGMISQFDGYFNLSKTLECEGGNNSGFQMKSAGGQYHKSQIIKQPDVMVLFSYLDFEFSKEVYARNWDYYENMCEASSSLTYPVHAICSFDNDRLYSGYKYLKEAANIDLADLHGGAEDGIHAGCSAGAWYAVVRGIAGIKIGRDGLSVNPKMLPWWKSLKLSFCYRGVRIYMELTNDKFTLKAEDNIVVNIMGKDIKLNKEKKRTFSLIKKEIENYDAVIFDLDGVLVTTDDCHYKAWKRLADEEGIYFDRKINERLCGVSRMESLEIVLEKANRIYTQAEKTEMAARKNGYYVELVNKIDKSAIINGAEDFVKAVKKAGLKTAVGSSSKNSKLILEKTGLTKLFDVIVDGNDIKNSKPDPEVFQKAAERLGVLPQKCLVCEDADAGVEAGVRAGMRVLAVGSAKNNVKAGYGFASLSDSVEELMERSRGSYDIYGRVY